MFEKHPKFESIQSCEYLWIYNIFSNTYIKFCNWYIIIFQTWAFKKVHIVSWQKALVNLIMFEQELIMFEQMPELALMNILLAKEMCKPNMKISRDIFWIFQFSAIIAFLKYWFFFDCFFLGISGGAKSNKESQNKIILVKAWL